METITWKNADLSGLVWELEANGNVYGKLKFFGGVGFRANFLTSKNQFQFKKAGFWGKKILITKKWELCWRYYKQSFRLYLCKT